MAWDSNAIAVYRFENNGNDSSRNSYTLTNIGTPAYSSTIFHEGDYSHLGSETTNTNYFSQSALPNVLAASASGWSMECWFKQSGSGKVSLVMNKGLIAAGGITLFLDAPNNRINFFTSFVGDSLRDNYVYCYNGTEYDTWIHWAITYTESDSKYRIYKNNSLVYTSVAVSNVMDTNTPIYTSWAQYQSTKGYLDIMIVSNITRTSFPTLPIPDGTYGLNKRGFAFNRMIRNNIGGVKC